MKKTLSLILAIILTFSMGIVAFAEEPVALTKDEAKAKAVEHVNFDSELAAIATSGTYNHDAEGTVEVYNITSTLFLKSGKTAIYKTTIDKYTGKIYNQSATVIAFESILLRNITAEQACSLAIEALGLNESTSLKVLTNEE